MKTIINILTGGAIIITNMFILIVFISLTEYWLTDFVDFNGRKPNEIEASLCYLCTGVIVGIIIRLLNKYWEQNIKIK